MELQTEKLKVRYLITGLIFGVIISIIINLITISINDYSFSIGSIIQMNKENPVNLLLIISPIIILPILAYISGISIEKTISQNILHINQNKKRFEYIYNFIVSLRKGKEDADFEEKLENDKIVLSLINLKNEIKKNKEENIARQEEEVQRGWTSEGLALFGALLREYNESIEILANKIISELVKYTKSKQAGFFIISENEQKEKYIKQLANFAYDKKRLANKEILWAEGLIGACIIEKKTSYLKNISKNYTTIESGLGAEKPKSLLIVPLMTEEGIVHGVIELASFSEYKEFEIKFIEQVAESIATTISSIKINEETAKLLKETKKHASTMAKQEEELRKTISDMERLQANADVQSSTFRAYQDSTNKSLINAEYTTDGKLLFANKKFLDILGYKSYSEIQNESLSKFLHSSNINWFEEHKEDILSNKHFEGLLNYTAKDGTYIWIESSYIGLRNDRGVIEKILFLGFDATDLKMQSLNLNKKIEILNSNILKLELSTEGIISNINNNFIEIIDQEYEEIINKPIIEFIDTNEANNLNDIIENVKNSGQSFKGEFSINKSNNIKVWLKGYVFQELDLNNNVLAINIIAFENTTDHIALQQIDELEKDITDKNDEIATLKDRLVKRVEQAKEEMKNLYVETETNNIFYENTLKLLPEIILSINNDNKLVFVNEKAKEFFSIDETYLDKDISEISPKISQKFEGTYLKDIFNYSNDDLPINKESFVYTIDKDNKPKKFKMNMNEISVGLRKRLTIILSETI